MIILKRKIFITAMVVFSIIVGLAAIVNISQNRQTIAAAEEVADSSPDADNVTATEVITQIESQLSEQGTSILEVLRNEKQTYTQELGSADETRRVIVESLIASIDEAIEHYENNDYSSNNGTLNENFASQSIFDIIRLKAGVAAIAAGFRVRGWILASELMWYNLTNKQLDIDYYPTNGGRVAQSTQIKSVANNGEISLQYIATSPGWLNGIFVDTIEGDTYNALGKFYYEKRYVGDEQVEISIIDRYDWRKEDDYGIGNTLVNLLYQAQEAEVVVPFYTNITLTVPGSSPFLWEYDDDGIKVTGFVGEVQTNIVPPEEIYDLRIRPQDSVSQPILSITAIGDGLYEGQSEIANVTFPGTIKRIGDRAFAGCSNLTDVSATDNLVYIGEGAFSGCSKLTTSFSLGALEYIGDNAFNGCALMPSINVGSMLTHIGENAFVGCDNLGISISDENHHYRVENNIVYNRDKSNIIASGNAPAIITIPTTVTEIKPNAFFNKSSISTLHIYGSPTIGSNAFSDCQNLRTVYFYSFTLPTFGSNSFANDRFTMYSPHALREQYISHFDQNVVTANSIPITITLKDGNAVINTLNVYFGAVINITSPVKSGYNFIGWYASTLFSGDTYKNGEYYTMITDATFYAKFLPIIYTCEVTFNKGGGDGGTSAIVITTGETLPSIVVPVKQFYIFDGYFDEAGVRYYYSNGEPANYVWDKAEDVTLHARWTSNHYTVTYLNLTFNGKTAQLSMLSDSGSTAVDKFIKGTTFKLSSVTPSFYADSAYSPQMRFLGWFTSKSFSTKVTETTSSITVYAKWRYDYDNPNRSGTYNITDDGAFNQGSNYDMISIGLNSGICQQLKDLGIKYLTINFKIRLWEVYDGYQEIYVYGGSGNGNLLWSKTDIEHGGSGKSTTPAVYTYHITIDINKLSNVDTLYIRYSAHGAGKDDWRTDKMYCELSYVVKTDDIYGSGVPAFYWSYQDPFK